EDTTMKVTVKDHEERLEQLLEDVRRAERDIASFVLFGTHVRGGIIPGDSDMVDGYCFLRNEAIEDKTRFAETIDTLASAFARCAQDAPFPVHSFFYWNEGDPVPSHFRREMTEFSRIEIGEDLRKQIEST